MRVSVCVGNYAETPYCFESFGIRVYCAEELCHALKENAFLLDADIMSDELITWLGEDCGLKELERELHPLVHRQGSLSVFVSMILQYVGFYDTGVVHQVEQTLKRGAGLSIFEKRKSRADYLVRKQKYTAAILEYDSLLAQWDRSQGEEREKPAREDTAGPAIALRAGLLHNKGVAMCGLMHYTEAAECFCKAYEAGGAKESFEAYLSAKRLGMPEEDYISFVAGLENSFEVSLRLEQRKEQLEQEWKRSEEALRLAQRGEWRESGDKQKYYEDNERLIRSLKDSYRGSVGE